MKYDSDRFIKCKWCGSFDGRKGTQECDGCWELHWRIKANPYLAEKMLSNIKQERECKNQL